ncbi:MAG TPA: alpha/beta fold hydrolase, partial [Humidesulfovibrio sp.]|uniref:alpha/beta fold hydrolase n=1 Tax=Humidesulfovibrio sp. TaxID=2910988 RepID=UPI002BC38BE2
TAEGGRIGVVLLHGKYGAPDRHISGLAASLREAGHLVATPEMPWSKRRAYNAGFLEALAEVDRAVLELRAKGATAVVVGGHSLGGNAALAYAARYPGVAGVLCLAAAHTPDIGRQLEVSAASVIKARELVAAGKGDTRASFTDLNMGKPHEMIISAADYLSYYDPEGPAVMPRSAALLKAPVPILWVAGSRDPLSRPGPGYAFERAPAHPLSRYVVVEADHLDTPEASTALALEWLKVLAR